MPTCRSGAARALTWVVMKIGWLVTGEFVTWLAFCMICTGRNTGWVTIVPRPEAGFWVRISGCPPCWTRGLPAGRKQKYSKSLACQVEMLLTHSAGSFSLQNLNEFSRACLESKLVKLTNPSTHRFNAHSYVRISPSCLGTSCSKPLALSNLTDWLCWLLHALWTQPQQLKKIFFLLSLTIK